MNATRSTVSASVRLSRKSGMIDRPSGPVWPGPSRITALGLMIDSAKYSAG